MHFQTCKVCWISSICPSRSTFHSSLSFFVLWEVDLHGLLHLNSLVLQLLVGFGQHETLARYQGAEREKSVLCSFTEVTDLIEKFFPTTATLSGF